MSGLVKLSAESSRGIEKADVLVNGKKLASTGTDGKFVLEKMTVGHYTLQVVKDNYEFDPVKVHLLPSKPDLATFYVSK